jgi:hypothetical protein
MKTLTGTNCRDGTTERGRHRGNPLFKVTCPQCGTSVITESPAELVWELCPGCWRYVWDISDAMMAEAMQSKVPDAQAVVLKCQ